MKRALCIVACLAALPLYAGETKPVTKTETVTMKATIEAIDHTLRTVTLMDEHGNYKTLVAEPEIRRFDELKVGDKVTFKYSESVAVRIRKPGEPVQAASLSEPAVVRGATAKPSGSVTQQATATVTIKAVDPNSKSITFTGEDGHATSVRVEDKSLVKNLHPGDKVEITYTTALLMSVE